MRQFLPRILVCSTPILLAAIIVGWAWYQYETVGGGFKLGVDLVGGTILVYEIDVDRFPEGKLPSEESFDIKKLAAKIKQRIDPNDLKNVTIRPVGKTRIEIILPTGGQHQSEIEEQQWKELIEAVRVNWPELKDAPLDVQRGHSQDLGNAIRQELDKVLWKKLLTEARQKWPAAEIPDLPPGSREELKKTLKEKASVSDEEFQKLVEANKNQVDETDITTFLNSKYDPKKRRDPSAEFIQQVKDLIKDVGKLEFRIVANTRDDRDAIAAAKAWLELPNDTNAPEDERAKRKEELERLAELGQPPPPPKPPEGETGFEVKWGENKVEQYNYQWFELGRQERRSLDLDNAAEKDTSLAGEPPNQYVRNIYWQAVNAMRTAGKVADRGDTIIYSRKCINRNMTAEQRADKKYEYFMLTRDPLEPSKAITGDYLIRAAPSQDQKTLQLAVSFTFNSQGGNLFYDLTTKNAATGEGPNRFFRQLAIILDGYIESAPRSNEPIRTDGQITGRFTKKEVDKLVSILQSGALPATLKQNPVSENTIGATLGADTIQRGTTSVGIAFLAVLAFMVVYYRFSGLVACVALFANLLLTIAFMVLVHATFTLPGLAGLVLMLAMAVDANVLIYERLREERERGASLALAIRNGYDRALPTIIDTHLTSIFTAIVLYAVGNDQLKGFGVSLAVGLIISLFTSLVVTRLMFDIWQSQGWLTKLSMLKLLTRTSIDFMRIRYYWFTATIVLTVLGLTVFVVRGEQGLNIDFTSGTAYSGLLAKPMKLDELHGLLGKQLKVTAKELEKGGTTFRITYEDGQSQTVELPNKAAGETPEQHEADVAERASHIPDLSVEQLFLSGDSSEGGKSVRFNVRTSEKAPDLVQVTIARLLREDGKSLLEQITMDEPVIKGPTALISFSKLASPGYVKLLLEREFKAAGENQRVEVTGEGTGKEGRYQTMKVILPETAGVTITPEKFNSVMEQARKAFAERPQPERLENFDSALAAETQNSAMWAIILSWLAILGYLWFRFGSWTFGAAAVICLMHDLFFTLGIIAFCHYIHVGMPWLATMLAIQDFKIDFPAVAALLTLVGYSVSDTIVVFDRIREVRGKNPELTPQMINDSVNQTLSRTLLTAFSVFLVVMVLYIWGGEGVHLFAFVMVVGVIVGTYSSIYIASPLLLMFGEGVPAEAGRERKPALAVEPETSPA